MIGRGALKKTDAMAAAIAAARRIAIEAAAVSFFVNLLILTGPLYMLQIYDRVLASRSHETLLVISLLAIVLYGAMAMLDFARSALLSRSSGAFEAQLKSLTFDLAMDAARLSRSIAADQPLRDLRQIRQFLASPALTAVFDAPWTPFFLAIVFLMHWLLGLVAFLGLIFLLVLAVVNEHASSRATLAAQAMAAEADRLAISVFRNVAASDAMGMRTALRKKWLHIGGVANDEATRATDVIGGLTASAKAFRLLLQSAILGTGAYLAIQSLVTPGVMIAASIIAGRALAPVEIVTGQWRNFSLSYSAFNRLRNIVDKAEPTPPRTELPPPKGTLTVENLYCQPGRAKRPVLKAISFTLSRGEALGIIGPSAAGKSTLVRAIVGVERPLSGEIRIGGANITQWDRDAFGRHVGFLPQEVELFSGTAAQNISRFAEKPRDEDIIEAAQTAAAHAMILNLSDGYDTEIGEGGSYLSAGQRQRLALARALYGGPDVVVLDEPNANLDAEGDAALAESVQALKARGATVIIVAHRPSAIAYADKLALLANGELRAFGPRDEILAQIAPKQITPFVRRSASGEAANV